MTDWFRSAQTGQPDPSLTKWLEPKLAACEQFAKKQKPRQYKTFVHGDTSEVNILLTRDLQLHLIDWDSSGFNQFPNGWDDFGVAYLMNHVSLFQKFRPLVVSLVSSLCNVSTGELEAIITRQQELIKLGDVQWAYMMNSRVAAGEIKGDPAKFLAIAKQRLDDYERAFGNSSFLS